MGKFITRFLLSLLIILLLVAAVAASAIAIALYVERESLNTDRTDLQAQVKQLTTEKDALAIEVEDLKEQLNDITPTEGECFNRSVDAWIVNNTPCANKTLATTYTLKGVAFGLFENTMVYSLELEDGTVIDSGVVTYTAPDLGIPGTYEQVVTWTKPADFTATEGILYLYGESAQDGSRQHVVTIPVNF